MTGAVVITITLPVAGEPDPRGWTADLEAALLAQVEDTWPGLGDALFTYSATYVADATCSRCGVVLLDAARPCGFCGTAGES